MLECGRLDDDEFAQLVRNAPLVSMDLIIRDSGRRVLLGLRQNEPAKNHYFVPGGRVRKNEMLAVAFARILDAETGLNASFAEARLLGVYQHLYSTNRFGQEGYGTHYVVLAYELTIAGSPEIMLDSQHSGHQWIDEQTLMAGADVHEYTKAYFRRPVPEETNWK
jgi:colanic acid biosynthesis protein WcaH